MSTKMKRKITKTIANILGDGSREGEWRTSERKKILGLDELKRKNYEKTRPNEESRQKTPNSNISRREGEKRTALGYIRVKGHKL